MYPMTRWVRVRRVMVHRARQLPWTQSTKPKTFFTRTETNLRRSTLLRSFSRIRQKETTVESSCRCCGRAPFQSVVLSTKLVVGFFEHFSLTDRQFLFVKFRRRRRRRPPKLVPLSFTTPTGRSPSRATALSRSLVERVSVYVLL